MDTSLPSHISTGRGWNPTNSYEVKRLTIYEFVKQRRKELGLTQKELADKATVSVSVVKRFESSRSYNPHGPTFIKMVRALETNSEFLMFECEWPVLKEGELSC